jgi:hypothetical protein
MCSGMRLQSFKRFLPLANPRSWTLRSTTDLSSDELESNRVRLTAIKPDNIATEQIVGRERRERELIADFQLPIVDLNLAVALTLTLSCFVSESRYIGINIVDAPRPCPLALSALDSPPCRNRVTQVSYYLIEYLHGNEAQRH